VRPQIGHAKSRESENCHVNLKSGVHFQVVLKQNNIKQEVTVSIEACWKLIKGSSKLCVMWWYSFLILVCRT
jgi:hypothetical protein